MIHSPLNVKFCYHVCTSLPPVPVPLHKNLVSTLRSSHPVSRRSSLILSSYLCLRLFPSFSLPKPCIFLSSPSYKFWCSLVCISLRPPNTSSLLVQNIFLSTAFSNTLILSSSLNVDTKFNTHIKQEEKL